MQKKFAFDYLPQMLYPKKPVRNSFLPHLTRAAKALDFAFTGESRACGCEISYDQFMLLVAVRENPNATHHELAASLCRERTAVTHALCALERDGWLEKHNSIHDRRKCIYVLTAKAIGKWDALAELNWRIAYQGGHGITEEEMANCINTLVKIFCNYRSKQTVHRLHENQANHHSK